MAEAGLSETTWFSRRSPGLGGGCGAALPQIWLGSILGYFAGGLLVGPSVFGIFTEPSTIPHLAELAILICPISN